MGDRGQRVLEVSLPAPPDGDWTDEPCRREHGARRPKDWQPMRTQPTTARSWRPSAIVSDLYPTHAALGYVVTRSAFAINPPGLLSRLVGDNATVLLGNRDGSVWVDLETSRRVTAPP